MPLRTPISKVVLRGFSVNDASCIWVHLQEEAQEQQKLSPEPVAEEKEVSREDEARVRQLSSNFGSTGHGASLLVAEPLKTFAGAQPGKLCDGSGGGRTRHFAG